MNAVEIVRFVFVAYVVWLVLVFPVAVLIGRLLKHQDTRP